MGWRLDGMLSCTNTRLSCRLSIYIHTRLERLRQAQVHSLELAPAVTREGSNVAPSGLDCMFRGLDTKDASLNGHGVARRSIETIQLVTKGLE